MTLEEKIRDIIYLFDQNHKLTFTDTSKAILTICQQEIDEAYRRQREICAEIKFDDLTMDGKEYILLGDRERIREKIRTAPSPKEK